MFAQLHTAMKLPYNAGSFYNIWSKSTDPKPYIMEIHRTTAAPQDDYLLRYFLIIRDIYANTRSTNRSFCSLLQLAM